MQILLAFSPHKIGFLSTRGRFPILPPMGGGLRLGPRKRILPVFWPGGLASATTRWPTSKRKESGHGKTHGRQGKRPHRVPTRLRKVSHPDRNRTRTPRFDGLARDPEPPDRQRKALRMLQQALQSLRRVRPAAFRRVLEQNPKELRALLRALPAILRSRLRTLGQGPVRLQRMREGTVTPKGRQASHAASMFTRLCLPKSWLSGKRFMAGSIHIFSEGTFRTSASSRTSSPSTAISSALW